MWATEILRLLWCDLIQSGFIKDWPYRFTELLGLSLTQMHLFPFISPLLGPVSHHHGNTKTLAPIQSPFLPSLPESANTHSPHLHASPQPGTQGAKKCPTWKVGSGHWPHPLGGWQWGGKQEIKINGIAKCIRSNEVTKMTQDHIIHSLIGAWNSKLN